MIPAHPPSEITASRYASRECSEFAQSSVSKMQSKAALFSSLDSEKHRKNTKTEHQHKIQIPVFQLPLDQQRPRRCQLGRPTTNEYLESLPTHKKCSSSKLMRLQLTRSRVFRRPGSLQLLNLALDLGRVGYVGLRARARKFEIRAQSLAFSALLILYLADERRSRSTGVPTGAVATCVRRRNMVTLGWRV
jgi:hypothetical protein